MKFIKKVVPLMQALCIKCIYKVKEHLLELIQKASGWFNKADINSW